MTQYAVYRWADEAWWIWGVWADRNRANEVALTLQSEGSDVWVREVEPGERAPQRIAI